MKTDKEYPATHSMSTSWYIVDDEGNVGIFDFSDNGPVPYNVKYDNCIYNLSAGMWVDGYDSAKIELTDDQLLELLSDPIDPNELYYWDDKFVQIDTSREKEFQKLMKHKDIRLVSCVSKALGLYLLDVNKCLCERYKADGSIIGLRSTLKRLLNEKIITNIYEIRNFFIKDTFEDGKITYQKNFDKIPYFIYAQPYNYDFLQKRVHVPNNPVKIDQLSCVLRRFVLHIPGNFQKMKYLQIAELFPSEVYVQDIAVIDDVDYALLPTVDRKKAWICISKDVPKDFQYPNRISYKEMKTLISEGIAKIKIYD